MPTRFSLHCHRALIALVCAPLLTGGSHAIEGSASATAWPLPAPRSEPVGPNAVRWPATVPLRTVPDFQAPSASTCARPVQMVEQPGRNAVQRPAAHGRAETRMSRGTDPVFEARADGIAEDRTMAAPMPVAPLASMAAPKSTGRPAVDDEAGAPVQRTPAQQANVTASMVDDNTDFDAYLAFRQRTPVAHRERDVRERHLLQVRNARGEALADAEVAVRATSGATLWARTDTAGRVWLHPDAFDPAGSALYEVTARQHGVQATTVLRRGQKSAVELTLDAKRPAQRARLDLVFLIDATGSMADEIGKLKATLRSIADEVARLPSQPDTCFGLVAYRDIDDAFVTRRVDFTNDLASFQGALNALQADGGGDYPEAMNEALHETVHRLSWRGDGATRLVILLADAPPHLDYGGPQYDDDMLAALGKGIKLFSVGASGLDRQGEYVQRQLAQFTGGRFVFLTYADAANPASGPGRETVHDVRNYSVETLDRLVVRLVRDELARLPKAG